MSTFTIDNNTFSQSFNRELRKKGFEIQCTRCGSLNVILLVNATSKGKLFSVKCNGPCRKSDYE